MAMTRTQVAAAASRLKEIDAKVEALTNEKNDLKAKLGELKVGEYAAGDYKLIVSTTKTVDAVKATKEFPADKFPEFYKLSLDVTEFRRHFSAVQVEKYLKTSPRITVK